MERADNVARFIDVNAGLILDLGRDRSKAQWEPLINTTGDEEDFAARYNGFDEKNVIRFLTFDEQNSNSVLSCVRNVRENARTVREVISSEMWEAVNAFYHLVQKHSRKRKIDDLQDFLAAVHTANNLFAGLIENTMSHGEAWHFARMGRMLERADKTARMLDVKYFFLLPGGEFVDSLHDSIEWGAVLKSVGGFEAYRKHYHRANYRDVSRFLLFDRGFPRAVRHCVDTASRSLYYVMDLLGADDAPAGREMTRLRKSLAETSVEEALESGLHEFIDALQYNLNLVHNALHTSFFAVKTVVPEINAQQKEKEIKRCATV